MGGKAPSTPPPTPPGETAKADFGAEAATAGYGMQHGTPNQISPGGFVKYDKYDLPDQSLGNGQTVPGGQGVSAVTTGFSPEFQGLFDKLTSAAGSRASSIPTSEWSPNLDTGAFRQSYIDEGLRDVTPEWNRADKLFRIQMSERGLNAGDEAWNDTRNQIDEQRGSYLQGLTNQGTQAAAAREAQQFQQQLTQRQLASSETTQAQSQIQSALAALQGRDAPLLQSNMQAPDMAAITARYDQANQQNAMMAAQSKNSALGLLGSLGGAAIGLLSDERVKDDIEKVGETDDGQNIYTYTYKHDPSKTTHMGLLAQEVEEKHPEAVGSIGGIKTVRYDLATKDASLARFLREAA